LMRVLVCGGRNYDDEARVFAALDAVHRKHGISLLIEGGASGADACGLIWAVRNRVATKTIEANWAQYGRSAGPKRNQRMLDEGRPEAVVAFPGGQGTADMVRRAKKANVPVWEVK
jgi:hypothetical protein